MNTTIHDMSAVRPHLTVTVGARKSILPNTVHFDGRWWRFTVPGEGTISARDSKQIRALIAMLLNKNQPVDVEDIELAVMHGPTVLRHKVLIDEAQETSSDDIPDLCDDPCAWGSDLPTCLDPKEQWKSAFSPDLLNSLDGEMSRHTGDAGDERIIKEIDRRVDRIIEGIAVATAHGDKGLAASLVEEGIALRKWRNWYVNSKSGKLRPFYVESDEKKFKRCRMWIVRGLQSLAAMGLPMAAARLNPSIDRGMKFIFTENPNWEWIVTPAPQGSLRHLGKKTDKPDNQEGDGSMAAA